MASKLSDLGKRITGAVCLVLGAAASATTTISADTVLAEDLFDNVVIAADDVTLDCGGHSIFGFPPSTGIALNARSGVTIRNCTVRGFLFGVQLNSASSVTIVDTIVENNVVNGLEANNGSTVALSGSFTARNNGVFGVLLSNNISMSMVGTTFVTSANTGGMQVGLSSSVFVLAVPPSPPTSIVAEGNTAFGLTVVSNSHMFLFGAVDVVTRRNGSNGMSIFTKSGLELDNGAVLTSTDNALNGVLLEDSTINMFNMPQFPGSRLVFEDNGEAGISVAKASVFDISGEGSLTSKKNQVGLRVDDGSTATVRNSQIVDNEEDFVITFAARADLADNEIGTIFCGKAVLLRGDEHCPRGKPPWKGKHKRKKKGKRHHH